MSPNNDSTFFVFIVKYINDMSQTEKTRLDKLIRDLKRKGRIDSVTDMARTMSIARSQLADAQHGGRPMTRKLAERIAEAYPEVNPEWLVNHLSDNAYIDGTTVYDDREDVLAGIDEPMQEETPPAAPPSASDLLMTYIDRLTALLERQQTQIDTLTNCITQLTSTTARYDK